MTRILRGYYNRDRLHQPAEPYINAITVTEHGEHATPISLLVDSGADGTIISPADAAKVFGPERAHTIAETSRQLEIVGVGAGATVVQHRLALVFLAEGDPPIVVDRDFWIAMPDQGARGKSVNHDMPSLLGRDSLNQFTVTLSAARNVVELHEETTLQPSE